MKKPALYSSASRVRKAPPAASAHPPASATAARAGSSASPADSHAPAASEPPAKTGSSRPGFLKRHDRAIVFIGGVAFALALLVARDAMRPAPHELTQDDIDNAVLYTMENKSLPSRAAKAAEVVMNSVVRVRGYDEFDEPGGEEQMQGVGTGVVVIDNGTILTNLHVVSGSKRVTVTFFDGSESDVELLKTYPENDLAVIRAKKMPDDLEAATLGSTLESSSGRRGGRDRLSVRRRPVDVRGRGVRARPRLPLAAGQAGHDRADPVRRGGEPGQQRRAAAQPWRRGGRHRHRPGQPDAGDQDFFVGIGFAATIESAGAAVGIPPF